MPYYAGRDAMRKALPDVRLADGDTGKPNERQNGTLRSSAEDNCVGGVAGGGHIVPWRSWRATADEDGQYCFASALDAAADWARQSAILRRPAILGYASWSAVFPFHRG